MTIQEDIETLSLIHNFATAGHPVKLSLEAVEALNDALSALYTIADMPIHFQLFTQLESIATYECEDRQPCFNCKHFNRRAERCMSGLASDVLDGIKRLEEFYKLKENTENDNN